MHARYALAFGRGAHRHALRERAAAAALSIRADFPDMLLLADEQTPVLTGGGAAVVGQVFSRPNERVQEFTDWLPSGCWGNFAFFGSANGRTAHVYREPSGSVPVYRIASTCGEIFVSDAPLAAALGLIQSAVVDRTFAIQWLQFPFLRSSRTGLQNVSELLAGMTARRTGNRWIEELAWNPWEHTRPERSMSDPVRAAEALRRTALQSVAAQVSTAPVLLQLSGGLDSSIIAACLHDARIPFTAVNFATRSADGDERRHAHAVASSFGASLFEIREDELPCMIAAPAERAFRPGSNPVLSPLDRAIEQHRRETGSAVLVDGGGGDNLFCYLTSAAPVLDALSSTNLRAAFQAFHDISARADCTWWQVASAALRRAARPRWRWKEDRRFLNAGALLAGPDPHPWLKAPLFSLPGKREHVASLVQIQHFLDRRLAAGTSALHPLMGQPLLEQCLAIPTWQWVRGGVDRAVAREAFKHHLPASIIERRTKGSLQGLFHRFFVRMRQELRDLLLAGELRRLGVLDPVAVEQAFTDGAWAKDEVQMRLSEMAALELWLKSWRL